MVTLGPVVPILRMFDIAKAREFYVDFLGFTWDWEHRFDDNAPLYAQISRAGVVIHLSEHHGDGAPGSHITIQTKGIAALHRELTAKKYRYARPGLEDQPWGARTITVADPFANRLTFSEPTE
ncbi:glyoxalase superfamily protein [uncultured Reyranella sp.]|uniref:glyoxalase superfamily protein n=1 Tax=uncultured Reyranella sp. TaxID=735512 RepID=UPI0025DB0663|nr:glyoxalase superfamily protein [uncultured Reyranella sp.]